MELSGIVESLENKTILVTGSTGFLAKIFVEKILRIQPNVKRLFLLLRATDSKSATQRLRNEVIGKEVFRVLRERHGVSLDSFIWDKVTPIPGDIAFENLGIKGSDVREEMCREIDIVVNIAATTNFDERYDVALGINTLGAKHVLDFAKKCPKLQMLLHVSTAYVCGEKEGLIIEKPFCMGETLNGTPALDIEVELKLAEERLNELRSEEATEAAERVAMKEMGIKRATLYGWPNTYVFTKAMGEMLLGHFRNNLPLVIIRPTIITSTYSEPFPGWIEGVRTIDSFIVAYGKGKSTCFLGDPESIIDAKITQIPGDMVVNSMIVAMVAHANQPGEFIYQVGSSARNIMKLAMVRDVSYRYFSKNPWFSKDGKPIEVRKAKILNTMASFSRFMAIHYILPLKGLNLVNMAFCQYFRNIYNDHSRKLKFAMRLVELYKPYLFFNGVIDDMNSEKLRIAVRENGVLVDMFYFDPTCIDWDDYFMNIHIPGVVRYVFK
ncbi:hypothetical protein HHK36_011351 [Tetracentron sinense]|uniref:Fatty acyl-CoA reductase n=1 Tax=Tetracentron sinense TaxID=13715 RepID=A0A834ZA94_TETSI|nr:hypothetical protein HHK36_011351 [Tetracentron sinense]